MKNSNKNGKHIVYRYVDVENNKIVYVGIAGKGTMKQRMHCHKSFDEWSEKHSMKIEYFECDNKSEAEAFESHLISLYGTDKYYNKYKSGWGINRYLPDVEDKWMVWEDAHFADVETMMLVKVIRKLIRLKCKEEALELLKLIDFEDVENGENG